MQEQIQIQLPNPQQAIYNSQSFQQAPSGSGGSGSSFFTLKNISLLSLGVLIVGGVGMGVMSVKNASDSYQRKISQRSDEISQILDEANGRASVSVVGKAEASYDNPFDKNNAYQNPFEDDSNPF